MAKTSYSVYRIGRVPTVSMPNSMTAASSSSATQTISFVDNVEARTPEKAVESVATESGNYFAIPSRYLKVIPAWVRTETIVSVTAS